MLDLRAHALQNEEAARQAYDAPSSQRAQRYVFLSISLLRLLVQIPSLLCRRFGNCTIDNDARRELRPRQQRGDYVRAGGLGTYWLGMPIVKGGHSYTETEDIVNESTDVSVIPEELAEQSEVDCIPHQPMPQEVLTEEEENGIELISLSDDEEETTSGSSLHAKKIRDGNERWFILCLLR